MDPRFLLFPLAAITIGMPAHATTYLTVEQAQALMFPGASVTADFRALTDTQVKAIERDSDVNVLTRSLRAWRVSTGGWFIADQVVGKHEFITFALALDVDGTVKSVEILEYLESYGDEVRNAAWRAQFTGKRHGAALKLTGDIKNISGATLSCRHVTDGVKRLLATYAIVLARNPD
jgi:Na+-translocating ferredoxin:NAD+ oxidoreductase RnfG subunit